MWYNETVKNRSVNDQKNLHIYSQIIHPGHSTIDALQTFRSIFILLGYSHCLFNVAYCWQQSDHYCFLLKEYIVVKFAIKFCCCPRQKAVSVSIFHVSEEIIMNMLCYSNMMWLLLSNSSFWFTNWWGVQECWYNSTDNRTMTVHCLYNCSLNKIPILTIDHYTETILIVSQSVLYGNISDLLMSL